MLQFTIGTKVKIPKCALLVELGWEPINAFLDGRRFSFFLRCSKVSTNRLSKVVLHELSRYQAQNTECLTCRIIVRCLKM